MSPAEFLSGDRHDAAHLRQVAPADWENPVPAERYNLLVVGAGPGGLVAAAGAAGLGARVALVEAHAMGGDCLNVGCVPSKTLIRSARAVHAARSLRDYGGEVHGAVEADFARVMERVRAVRASLSAHDSAERFRDLGVDVFFGNGRFVSSGAFEVEGKTIRFRAAVLATGARPFVPGIPGLAEAGVLTNETVFTLTKRPKRLAVIGGGPIGCELAQAFRRLGAEVHLFHRGAHLLEREVADAAAIVQAAFLREGLVLHLGTEPDRVTTDGEEASIHFRRGETEEAVTVDAVLAGAGRVPNVQGLGLEAAGVRFDERRGVETDDRLRTSARGIYAIGDVALSRKFTHLADATARLAIQNALFLGRGRVSDLVVPRVTYTDPEIAHVGMDPAEADRAGIRIDTYARDLAEVDRAVCDGETEGFVRVYAKQGTDRILGATVVARHAGEMIGELALAIRSGAGLGTLSGTIHPYPTQAEAIRQAGDAWSRTRLTPLVKSLMERWLAWRR